MLDKTLKGFRGVRVDKKKFIRASGPRIGVGNVNN